MKEALIVLLACAVLSGCATNARFYKAGMTDEQFKKDCYDARTLANQNSRNIYGDNLNALGVILESNSVDAEFRRCMTQKFGYTIIDPRCTKVFDSGLAYLNKKEYAKAISDFTKAIEINPNYTSAYYNRGLGYASLKDYTEAISDFTKAIEIEPDNIELYCNRGLVYSRQNNLVQAISDFTKAIEIAPNDAKVYYSRSIIYYMTKEYDKCWADLNKAKELGCDIDSNFLNGLKKDSKRDK